MDAAAAAVAPVALAGGMQIEGQPPLDDIEQAELIPFEQWLVHDDPQGSNQPPVVSARVEALSPSSHRDY